MIAPAGILYDLSRTDGHDSTVDLGEFFPVSSVLAVKHNDSKQFNDVRRGEGRELDFSKPRTLRISKYRTKKTSDILKRSECAPSIVAYVDKSRPVRPEPVSVIDPLEIPDFAYDLRNLEPVATNGLHPDLFAKPLPFGKKAFRYLKKRRAKIFKIGLSGSAIAVFLI